MKRFSDNELERLIPKYSLILSLVFFVISFLFFMPHKPSKEVLENYNTLAFQIMNEGIFAQEIDYSALAVNPEDMHIKIHPEIDDAYAISIGTPNVIVNINYQDGRISNVSYTYWTLYLLAILISLSIAFVSFIFMFFVVGIILSSISRKKS